MFEIMFRGSWKTSFTNLCMNSFCGNCKLPPLFFSQGGQENILPPNLKGVGSIHWSLMPVKDDGNPQDSGFNVC